MGLVPVPLLLGRKGKSFSFNKSWFGFAGLSHVCSTKIGTFALMQASAYEILLVTFIVIISASFFFLRIFCYLFSFFFYFIFLFFFADFLLPFFLFFFPFFLQFFADSL